jgi:hypothetical protein
MLENDANDALGVVGMSGMGLTQRREGAKKALRCGEPFFGKECGR